MSLKGFGVDGHEDFVRGYEMRTIVRAANGRVRMTVEAPGMAGL